MPQNVKTKGPLNVDLQLAVVELYKRGMIKKDKEIAEKTGFSAGQVSSYINGRAPMSPKFRETFETIFKVELADFVGPNDYDGSDNTDKLSEGSILAKYIKQLEEDKAFLKRLVESSLIDIADRQMTLQAEVQAVHQWDAQQAAAGNKAKEVKNLQHIHQLVAGNRERNGKTGKMVEADSNGKRVS